MLFYVVVGVLRVEGQRNFVKPQTHPLDLDHISAKAIKKFGFEFRRRIRGKEDSPEKPVRGLS